VTSEGAQGVGLDLPGGRHAEGIDHTDNVLEPLPAQLQVVLSGQGARAVLHSSPDLLKEIDKPVSSERLERQWGVI